MVNQTETTVLVVMSGERRRPLLDNLKDLKIDVVTVANCREARNLLRDDPTPIELVVTDVQLPDGSWLDVSKSVSETPKPAGLIVSTRLADERLWSEVLWRGAYDLLVEPYEKDEVRRILEGALRTHAAQSKDSAPPVKSLLHNEAAGSA